MKKYELLFILPGTLDDTEVKARAEEIVALAKEHSQNAELHVMGKNRLSYPIKGIRYGYFYTIVFEAESAGLKAIQDKLVLMRDILRTMITYFKVNVRENQHIAYSTDEAGITTMVREKSLAKEEVGKTSAKKDADLADIDAKLDKILEGDIVPGI